MPVNEKSQVMLLITAAAHTDRISVAQKLDAALTAFGFETTPVYPAAPTGHIGTLSTFHIHRHILTQQYSLDPGRPTSNRKTVNPIPLTDCELNVARVAVIGGINTGKTILMRFIAAQLNMLPVQDIAVHNHNAVSDAGMNGCAMKDLLLEVAANVRISILLRPPVNNVTLVDILRSCDTPV